MKSYRCKSCNKKIATALIGAYTCKCGAYVCGTHKPVTEHACTFDHKQKTKQDLTNRLEVIKPLKLEKI